MTLIEEYMNGTILLLAAQDANNEAEEEKICDVLEAMWFLMTLAEEYEVNEAINKLMIERGEYNPN